MTITQMADNTTLFLQDLDSIKYILDMLHQWAGLELNKIQDTRWFYCLFMYTIIHI